MYDFDSAVTQRIIEVRTALGLTQEKFAQGIKISKAYQCQLESNVRKINARIIKIIALVYGVNENWLKKGTGDMFDHFIDPKIEQIVCGFKQLNSHAQSYILKQIELLIDYEKAR